MSKPLVSISLLCSNRKKTIRKCLESLQPLRDAVSTELIIVDTGCDEETRAILEEFADQIVEFEWCKDFSKARNAGLKKCSGEWFLYLDDDEWFIDMDEIVEFFLSGNYKKSHYAFYIQRNYYDYKENRHSDSWVSRMIRLEKDTRFISSIHEFLVPIKGKPVLLHSAVKHFGYIFDSEEEKYKHSERNISLLWDMIKKERNNLRWWAHLIQEYFMLREHNKLIEVCNEALEISKNENDYYSRKERAAFYVARIKAANFLHQPQKAIEFFEAAIADKRNLPVAQGALYGVGTRSYFIIKDIEKGLVYGKKYLEVYEKYVNDEVALLNQSTFVVRDEYKKEEHCVLISAIVSMCLRGKNFEEAFEYFQKMGWHEENVGFEGNFIKDIVDVMAENEYHDSFAEMAKIIIGRKGVSKLVISQIMKKADKQEELERLATIFSQTESEHYFIWYLKILHADKIGETSQLYEYYKKLFTCVIDILAFSDKIWEIAKKYNLNLDELMNSIPFDNWKKGVDTLCEGGNITLIKKKRELLNEIQKSSTIRYEYFDLKATEVELAYADSEEDYDVYRNYICDFIERSLSFYSKFFKDTAFEGDMDLLSASCRVAVKLKESLLEEEQGDYKKVLELLKDAVGVFSPFDHVIQKYSKMYAEKVKNEVSNKTISTEMQQLAEVLKEKARELLEVGDTTNAIMILKQISGYVPEDEEIKEMLLGLR